MTYQEALRYIAGMQGRGWRLGLDRMSAFVDKLGLSEFLGNGKGPQFIHVGGTNGKGSVTAFVQAVLASAGFKTGGYFSPYVYDIRERVQLNCCPISKADLADLVARMQPIADSFSKSEYGEITEFEFKTALGFLYWAESHCEWVALEVGLGGKLDATNVVTPAVSVITSIGLDHTEILGTTEREIAGEKAGIIKAGRPVVVGDVSAEALEVIGEKAESVGAPLLHCPRGPEPIRDYNAKLASLAVGAAGVEISPDVRKSALEGVKLPGRYQTHSYEGTLCILDGAHNPPAARVLAELLRRDFPGRRMVLLTGMLSGHEPAAFYESFEGLFSAVITTSIDFHRAIDPIELARQIPSMAPICESHPDRSRAIARAIDLAGREGIIVISGSFYLVGAMGRMIGADRMFTGG